MPSNSGSNENGSAMHEEPAAKELKYPKAVFFIIGNEFCERFTYYGLRTILTLFIVQRLLYSEDTGTIVTHSFTMLAYFTPVLGAIVADSWLGKFKTILYISILYCIGSIVLAYGAFPNEISTMTITTIIGLVIIGFGTGGIKPCVSAFGGDQFKAGQERQLQRFFSFFYLSINMGSVISTYVTPILREDVKCLGENTCYPLAFGVPAMLMIGALLFFICGKPLYKIRPPEGNIVLKVMKCICYAIGKKCKSTEKKKSHWLDYAEDNFDKDLIKDIKIILHILVLYLPLPVFWALFDQQATRWVLQATRLDGMVGTFHIKADQMQVINPLLIIIFVPLFDFVLYPLLEKCNLLKKPLQRITTGGFLAAIAFVLASLLELQLERSLPFKPISGESEMTIINNSPCPMRINGTNIDTLDAFKIRTARELKLGNTYTWTFNPDNCTLTDKPRDIIFNATTEYESMMVTIDNDVVTILKTNESKTKSDDGEPKIRFFYDVYSPSGNVSFKLVNEIKESTSYCVNSGGHSSDGMTEYCKVPPGRYKIYLGNGSDYQENPFAENELRTGGVYVLTVYSKENKPEQHFIHEMVKGNFIPILVQIPQYVIITAAEVMFSITGLEFSYSQAPISMKSVMQSAWLLTVAFGNLLVLIVTKSKIFERLSSELFLFTALMAVDMVIFGILAYNYTYVEIKSPSDEEAEAASSPKGSSNEGYVEETDFNK